MISNYFRRKFNYFKWPINHSSVLPWAAHGHVHTTSSKFILLLELRTANSSSFVEHDSNVQTCHSMVFGIRINTLRPPKNTSSTMEWQVWQFRWLPITNVYTYPSAGPINHRNELRLITEIINHDWPGATCGVTWPKAIICLDSNFR